MAMLHQMRPIWAYFGSIGTKDGFELFSHFTDYLIEVGGYLSWYLRLRLHGFLELLLLF